MQYSYPEDDTSWREKETKYFTSHRDKNGDGILTKDEISLWLHPPNNDPCVNEAKHLIHHADVDKVRITWWYLYLGKIFSQQTSKFD